MSLNSLMSLSEAGVVLGVVLEGTEYVPVINNKWPQLEKIGFLILVMALVADWHFQSAINDQQTTALISASTRLATLNLRASQLEKDLAAARPQIAIAQQRAAEAELHLANANKAASEASAKAEQFRLNIAKAEKNAADAELALEKYKAPRNLDDAQQRRIAGKLSAYGGQKYTGQVASGIPDAWPLWAEINKALSAAGWLRVSPTGLALGNPPASIPIVPNNGVTIYVRHADVSTLGNAVKALILALKFEGLFVHASFADD